MPFVYRVENKRGQGMYSGSGTEFLRVSDVNHPAPTDDAKLIANAESKGIRVYPDYLFGFNSIKQLRKWLYKDEWLHKLHEAEYGLSVIYVYDEDFIDGDTQVIFNSKKIKDKYQSSILSALNLPGTPKLEWDDLKGSQSVSVADSVIKVNTKSDTTKHTTAKLIISEKPRLISKQYFTGEWTISE